MNRKNPGEVLQNNDFSKKVGSRNTAKNKVGPD